MSDDEGTAAPGRPGGPVPTPVLITLQAWIDPDTDRVQLTTDCAPDGRSMRAQLERVHGGQLSSAEVRLRQMIADLNGGPAATDPEPTAAP